MPLNMRSCGWTALLSAVPVAIGVSIARPDDIADINAFLDRVEAIYVAHDVGRLAECLSENFVAVLDLPNWTQGARVLNKDGILLFTDQAFTKGTAQQVHLFTQRTIKMAGGLPLAFLRTVSSDKWPDGRITLSNEFRILIREGDAWRMLLAVPCFFEPAAMVTEVFPSSQAERLGLRAGDLVAEFDGEKMASHDQLVDAIKRRSPEPADVKKPVKIKRGAEELTLQALPGQWGVKLETRLFPAAGATMIGADQPHPVKDAKTAIEWYRKGARMGHEPAKDHLARLKETW